MFAIALLFVAALMVLSVNARPGTFWSLFISPFRVPLTASPAGTSVRWHGAGAAALSGKQSPLTHAATISTDPPAGQQTKGAPVAGWLKPGAIGSSDGGPRTVIRT